MFKTLVGRGDSHDDHLSKKSDSPRIQPADTTISMSTMVWSGLRRRRVLLGLVVVLAVYLFVRNLPTDLPPVSQRYNKHFGSLASGHSQPQLHQQPQPHPQPQPKPQSIQEAYEGPVRFTEFAEGLQNFVSAPHRENVVFAVPQLASAAKLLPLACQMGRQGWNTVHVVLLGRSNITLQEVVKVNGLTLEDCSVVWHDARPDHAIESSVARMSKSVQTAMYLVNRALRPAAVLTDDLTYTDGELLAVVKKMTAELRLPLIALPKHALQDMAWITMLEGRSLKHFNDVRIDIVIQPYSQSAGSLLKLLRSLKNAHYHGLPLPRLTIELPANTDPIVLKHLPNFRWPPRSRSGESKLSIRRRVSAKLTNSAEAALRSVETFYPVRPSTSHVLFLNPDMELSPGFMHYLMFTVLEFKYGSRSNLVAPNLFGIALELPSERLDGSKPFLESDTTKSSPFVLSQSPNSNAALYFGDRWTEFHSFLSHRLLRDGQLKKKKMSSDVSLSKHHPIWLTHALEIMRARGWLMLYPSFSLSDKDNMATLHTELMHTPQDFSDLDDAESSVSANPDSKDGKTLPKDFDMEQITEPMAIAAPFKLPSFMSGNTFDHSDNRLPTLSEFPLLDPSAKVLHWPSLGEKTVQYANDFSLHFGGCSSLDTPRLGPENTVESLFCGDQS